MSTLVVRGGLLNSAGGNFVPLNQDFPSRAYGHNTGFNFKVYSWNTRTAISSSASFDAWGVTYNKLSPTSTIYVRGYLRTGGVVNGQVGWYVRYGTSARSFKGNAYAEWQGAINSGVTTSGSTGLDGCHNIHSIIAGYTTTGQQTLYVGWQPRDGSSNAPGTVFNPNNTDDSRTRPDSSSMLMVWEVEV